MALALVVGGAALAAPGLAAANPACGQTVKASVTLTGNMSCPSSSNGIVIGRAGITINLNHFTLTGPIDGNYFGIDNAAGYDKVTVENGIIKNFQYGILNEYTTGSKIIGVQALNAAQSGFAFWYSQNGLIDHSYASGDGYRGFDLEQNYHVDVTNSRANHDGTYGLYDYQSLSTINKVTANYNSDGFYVDFPVFISPSEQYTITNSIANHNTNGFYIANNFPAALYEAYLASNTADNNTQYGFWADNDVHGKPNSAKGNGTANCWHVTCH